MRPSPASCSLTCFKHDLGSKTSRVTRKGIIEEALRGSLIFKSQRYLKQKGKPYTSLFPQSPPQGRFSISRITCRKKSRKPPNAILLIQKRIWSTPVVMNNTLLFSKLNCLSLTSKVPYPNTGILQGMKNLFI